MASSVYCDTCGDDCIRTRDAQGRVWWVHRHHKNDSHPPVPVWDEPEGFHWTTVDTFIIMFIIGLGLLWLVVNR